MKIKFQEKITKHKKYIRRFTEIINIQLLIDEMQVFVRNKFLLNMRKYY